jgi:hypothetical protein
LSWQEELRKLDEELAAGQISADDYRVRRDQVLSSAVSFGPPGQAAQPAKQDETQFIQTVPPQPPSPPPPPPPPVPDKTQVVGDQADADKTQIVPGQTAAPDRTQAIGGGWQTARPSGADSDRTQVVPGIPGVPPQQLAGGQPRPVPGQFPPPSGYQPPGWQQEEDLSPPWAGADFPPLAPAGSPDWIRQGPEVFDTDRRSNTGKIVAIVAIVLLLAGLGVGGYFLFRGKGDNQAQQPPATSTSTPDQTTKSSPRPTTSTPPPKPIVQPPGAVQVDSTFTLQRLGEVKILSPEDFDILSRNQITEAQVQVTKEGELVRGTWAFTAADRASAEQVFKEIDALYRQVNFQPAPGIAKENVSALYFKPVTPNAPTVFRAHYLAGNKVIRVESYGPDAAQAAAEFAALLETQLQRLPAS